MSLDHYAFLPLSEEKVLLPFSCNDEDLNSFLFDDAKHYLDELLAVTYIFEDSQAKRTVAYFSLLNDKVALNLEEKSFWNRINRKISNKKRRKTYPSVKIGRLAVSAEYSGQGIGRDILNFITHAFTNGNRTGCRFITVDAYANATDFYLKNDFEFFTDKDRLDDTRLMIFDLKPFKDKQGEPRKSKSA